jgi:hypothetical protein
MIQERGKGKRIFWSRAADLAGGLFEGSSVPDTRIDPLWQILVVRRIGAREFRAWFLPVGPPPKTGFAKPQVAKKWSPRTAADFFSGRNR